MYPITVISKAQVKSLPPNSQVAYIGRPSPLGNPNPIIEAGGTMTRDESVDAFVEVLDQALERHVPGVRDIMNQLYQEALTAPLYLVCYCAPKRCHGDVIKRKLEDTYNARHAAREARKRATPA